MAIRSIDLDLCDGCNICIDSCPADVLRLVDNVQDTGFDTWKVIIAYPNECHSCSLCEIDCPVDAIKVEKSMMIPTDFQTRDGYAFPTFKKGGAKAVRIAEGN